jgi:hypothetical protein
VREARQSKRSRTFFSYKRISWANDLPNRKRTCVTVIWTSSCQVLPTLGFASTLRLLVKEESKCLPFGLNS